MVLSGLVLQFIFGLLILKWTVGFKAFNWIGDQITIFLAYSDAGSAFVFGQTFYDHELAFAVSLYTSSWIFL